MFQVIFWVASGMLISLLQIVSSFLVKIATKEVISFFHDQLKIFDFAITVHSLAKITLTTEKFPLKYLTGNSED